MSSGKILLATLFAAVISIGVAVFGQRWLEDGQPLDIKLPPLFTQNDDRLHSLPDFRLPDMEGREVASTTWAGKVLILNFWATWCPPCLRELPLLAEANASYPDVQVVGIAIDAREDVARFLAENPVDYPILLGDTEAIEMSRRLGNRLQGLPFTVIFDSQGKRVHAQIGEVTRASLEKRISPLLPKPQGAQTAGN